MDFVALARKYLACTALICFALGGSAVLLGVRLLGTPWERVRVVEVEKIVEKPVLPPSKKDDPPRADLVVMQKGRPLGLDSEFREYFVQETAKMPEVERVSEGIVGNANILRDNGTVDDTIILVQGWKPDNFGYEHMEMIEGRRLVEGDRHKIMLGRILAANLQTKVGDKLNFVGDPDNPYEVVGILKSRVVFEEGGAIVPFIDGQLLHGRKGKVTGFSVRVKKSSSDHKAAIEAVRQKIEALRDPEDPTVRLSADPTS